MTIVVVPAARAGRNFGCRFRSGVNDSRCPPGTDRQFHAGVDVAAPEGSPIYCPLPGEVLGNYPNGTFSRTGNCLFVGTYDRTTLAFLHMMELATNPATGEPWRVGDIVRAGEQIGRVGATGACKGWPGRQQARNSHGVPCTNCGPSLCGYPLHLHFEVIPGYATRPNSRGRRIDPREYARLKGFAIHSGSGPGGLSGLGELPVTTDPFAYTADKYQYFDPLGFEIASDEPAPLSAPAKIVIGVAAGGVLAFVLAKVLS